VGREEEGREEMRAWGIEVDENHDGYGSICDCLESLTAVYMVG
jgi:hypothetical protein